MPPLDPPTGSHEAVLEDLAVFEVIYKLKVPIGMANLGRVLALFASRASLHVNGGKISHVIGNYQSRTSIRLPVLDVLRSESVSEDIGNTDWLAIPYVVLTPLIPSPSQETPPAPTPREIAVEAFLQLKDVPKALSHGGPKISDNTLDAEGQVFTLSFRTQVGESVIPALAKRVVQIRSLVLLARLAEALEYKTTSLEDIRISYSSPTPAAGDGEVAIDRPHQYTATLHCNLVSGVVRLSFAPKYPHTDFQQLLDLALSTYNTVDKITYNTVDKITKHISILYALPVQQALKTIERVWEDLRGTGDVVVGYMGIAWYYISYKKAVGYGVEFEVKIQNERPCWIVTRTDSHVQDDEFDTLIRNLSSDDSVILRADPIAEPVAIERLLLTLDAQLRKIITAR
jgi:hypothetical protein